MIPMARAILYDAIFAITISVGTVMFARFLWAMI
jgi:hypothetical protein